MNIRDILKRQQPCFSFEFFPPRTREAGEQLYKTIEDLVLLRPSYVSVTYGAGGSTRDLTHGLVIRIREHTRLTLVAHMTCVGATQHEIGGILQEYQEHGIENIMALRGDPPKGEASFIQPSGGFAHAGDLVAYIRRHFPTMGIGVAGFPEGHPETPNRLKEMEYLKAKVEAGADYVCTQMFFDNRDFYDFCERCQIIGIQVPIIAGIMPITSIKGMARMAELALGARFPARLTKSLVRAKDDEYVESAGIHWATEQVRDLIDNGVKGVHFYTLNRSKATLRIYETLGLKHLAAFAE
ncbi:MAG TPA: methylenetetrahydrofolate reductase [NAD(P)H] [Candidatus Methylomirabilis sp.]|nr:methylenetetrahydrofolate reductase [NAD(P)H] [Candidatus Methylomirabilis sp.]